jgi:eukaryotic-like serine/threonine-protein kinase
MNKFYGIFVVAVLCLSFVSVFSFAVNAQVSESWTMFHYDLAHSGYSTNTGPTSNQTLWIFNTNGKVWSSPIVANGIVYFGSLDHHVYAVDAKNGTKIWDFTADGQVYPTPAYYNNAIYVGSDDHNFYALDAKSGSLLWKYATGNQVQSSAIISDGIVYFGSSDYNFYALNATNGGQLWNFTTGNSVISSPCLTNGVVFFGSYDHKLYALDAQTGAEKWNYPTGNAIESSPVFGDDTIYVGSHDNTTYAVNANTGALLWKVPTGNADCIQASPAYVNGIVYTGDSYNGNVLALDGKSGATKWNYTTGSYTITFTGGQFSGSYTISGVYTNAVVGNVEYSGALDNKTYALNAETGAFMWSYQTNGNIYSSPTVANGVLYFGSDDHNVYAVGQSSSNNSGFPAIPNLVFYAVIIIVLVVIIAVAIVIIRRQHK